MLYNIKTQFLHLELKTKRALIKNLSILESFHLETN